MSGTILIKRTGGILCALLLASLTARTRASNTPISDAAFPLLLDRTQTNRQAFYGYRDADSGFNHGFPSGLFGTTSKIHIDTAAIDGTNSPSGVSTNLNVLDRQLGNVLRVKFDAFSSGQFAGVNFEEPEGWGTSQTGKGYNLTGVTQVVVRLRSPTPGGIAIQFGVAGFVSGYVAIPQSSNYITLPLALAIPPSSLTNVHIIFSIATDVAHAAGGGTVLVDFVRFDPNPFTQTNALGFPLSYETFGVVPRTTPAAGREPYPLDQVLRNLTTPYESALTLMALVNRGGAADLVAARMIATTFVYALNHDNHGDPLPATNNAAGLHNGFMNGNIALFNGQGAGAGQQGDVRLAGFSCGSASPTGFCVLLDGATGGNNAFSILALASAYKRFGDTNYLEAARTIGHWIVTYLKDSSGTGYGGYFLGYPDQGAPKVLIQSKSVENNADICASLFVLAELERQLGNTAAFNEWTTNAYIAGDFALQMFDSVSGKFFAGTVPVGTPMGPGITPSGATHGNDVINTFDFLDANSFTTFALAGSPRYRSQIDWRRPIQFTTNRFARTITAGGQTFKGFGLSTNVVTGPDGIAWEFTGQAVAAMNYVDGLYGETRFANAASIYLNQIRLAQTNAPFGDGRGVVASTVQDGDTLPPIEQSLSTPFQGIPERVGLAATTWAIFAEGGLNPLSPDIAFRITDIRITGTNVFVSFNTLFGKTYRFESSTNLIDWPVLVNNIAGTGTVVEISDTFAVNGRRFYRVRQVP